MFSATSRTDESNFEACSDHCTRGVVLMKCVARTIVNDVLNRKNAA
jgi:hypothetical protein